jgi:hypothetical protein
MGACASSKPEASSLLRQLLIRQLLTSEIALEDDQLRMTLVWHCLGAFDAQETIFVHALDESGQPIGQADGDPLRGLFPLSECQVGEQIRDVRSLSPTSANRYTVKVGVYNRQTGERLNAVGSNGEPLSDRAATITQVNR